jgi:RHS repeat-associated protein
VNESPNRRHFVHASYYRARYYDSGTGRFSSEDPLGFSASVNSYTYVGNAPLDWLDPAGLDKVEVCWRVAQRFDDLLFVPRRHRASISFAYYPLWAADVHEGAALLCFSRVRGLTFPQLLAFSYAQSFAALLRARRPSFRHLQLLSAPAVSWNRPGAPPFCEDTAPSPLAIQMSAARLRRPRSYRWLSQPPQIVRRFGSGASTTSTCGATEKGERNWITCTEIPCNASLFLIPRTGHGAVGRAMKKEKSV